MIKSIVIIDQQEKTVDVSIKGNMETLATEFNAIVKSLLDEEHTQIVPQSVFIHNIDKIIKNIDVLDNNDNVIRAIDRRLEEFDKNNTCN